MGAFNFFANLSPSWSWVKLIHGQRAGCGSVSTGHVRKPTMHQHHTSLTPGWGKRIRQSCPQDSIATAGMQRSRPKLCSQLDSNGESLQVQPRLEAAAESDHSTAPGRQEPRKMQKSYRSRAAPN